MANAEDPAEAEINESTRCGKGHLLLRLSRRMHPREQPMEGGTGATMDILLLTDASESELVLGLFFAHRQNQLCRRVQRRKKARALESRKGRELEPGKYDLSE